MSIHHPPSSLHPPFPNPSPISNSVTSHPLLPNPNPNLSATLSSLNHLIDQSEQTLQSLLTLLPLQTSNGADSTAFVSCPFDSRHVMPPSAIFPHFLRCSSSQAPLQDDILHPRLNYLETLKPSSSSRAENNTILRALHGSGNEPCFSLDDFYADFGSNFFYRDCHGVVSLSSLAGVDRTFTLPAFLSVECENFEGIERRDTTGFKRRHSEILSSELWAVRAEVEAWNQYPSMYSYRVLCAISGLNVVSEWELAKWIIANSPRYGIVIDDAMRDHILLLCRLCLKAIQKESWNSASVGNRDPGMKLGNMNFSCPVLVQTVTWLASQLSVLYGEMAGNHFALDALKQCILNSASDILIFSLKFKDAKELSSDPNLNEIKSLNVEKQLDMGSNGDSCNVSEESITDGVIFVSLVAASIAALHERSLLEQKIKGLRFLKPLNNYQRMAEHNYMFQKAYEDRRTRPQYRAIIDHDGIPQLRISNEEANKTKTKEELLAEERDYKRRRMSYRGKKVKRSKLEVTRDIIEDFMDEIKQAGGIGCFEKDIQRDETLTAKTTFQSETMSDIDEPSISNYDASSIGHGYRKQCTSYKSHTDIDSEQSSRFHYNRRDRTDDEKNMSRDGRDRDYNSRSQRDYVDSGSRHRSSSTSKHHSDRSSAERKSKSRDRRHRDGRESYSSECSSRNRINDRYDPSESHRE